MRHEHPTDEVLELAAHYALGALLPDEAATFEAHLAEGCDVCTQEVNTLATAAGHLGYAAAAEKPRPEVRDRLLARLQAETEAEPDRPAWTIVRSTEGEWEAGGAAGITVKRLFRDAASGRFTILGRMGGGVSYPSHRHADTEELYILDGDLIVEGQELRAGDYCAAISGTVHDRASSGGGCTFLLSASERDEVVDGSRPEGPQTGLVIIRSTERGWREGLTGGVAIRPLFSDRAQGTMTGLVRMRPGARLPEQRRVAGEQLYVLEGDLCLASQVLRAGDYYRGLTGMLPDVTSTHDGCLFLLIASRVGDPQLLPA